MSQPIPPSAVDWTNLFNLAAFIAVTAVVIVIGVMVFFAIKYREKKGQPKFIPEIGLSKSRARETVIFISISIILLLSLTIASYRLTPNARFPPPISKSLIIKVTAFQWDFTFVYPNGASITGTCYVPANKSIIFNVTSSDVMHGFGLMDFKVKIEAIPGRYNVIGVTTPSLDGNSQLNYTIRCYELCGAGHTYMDASLIVLSPTAFDNWLGNETVTNSTTLGG
ncbi:MAG: cytochrome c oxidase subunit II [Candidatus Bathyarchaeia archaeon]